MHVINVHPEFVACSCGWQTKTREGQRIRPAYIHARANRPSVVIDTRDEKPEDVEAVAALYREEESGFIREIKSRGGIR